MKRVLVVEQRLPHYRVPFFEALRAVLGKEGVDLTLSIGTPQMLDASKRDEGQLEWARRLPAHYAFGNRVCWLPFDTKGVDLVIVSQENRFLFHPWLLRPWRDYRVGLMGHGANLAADSSSLAEVYKRWLTRRADWWFAYTETSRGLFERAGCPADRITVFDNAIDTSALRRSLASVSATDVAYWRQAQSLPPGPIGVFIGSLYAQKQLGFLLDAAQRIRALCPGFSLIIAGDGPDRRIVQDAAAENDWIKWVGPVREREKAMLLRSADVMLMPYAVGLSVVDAFAAGVPVCTTSAIGHGPELHYLRPNVSGISTAPDTRIYAETIVSVMSDPARLAAFRRAALEAADELSIEKMTQKFGLGVMAALDLPRRFVVIPSH